MKCINLQRWIKIFFFFWINLSAVNANGDINNEVFPSYLDQPTTVIYHSSEYLITPSVMRISEVTNRIISI